MKQPVDSFFNKKLKNYNAEAPISAWDRIDVNLSQKKKPVVWLKIAASLLLIAVAGFIVYTTIEPSVEQVAEVNKHVTPIEKEIINTVPEEPELEKTEAVQPQRGLPETTIVKYSKKKTETPKTKTLSVELPAEIIITPTVMIAENTVEFTPEVIENPIEAEIQNTTILISAEEANAKYLNQQYIADATSENKKSSKIRNLFEKAQDLDPIGEIRQFKNEVLAMNFRNEKKGERNR